MQEKKQVRNVRKQLAKRLRKLYRSVSFWKIWNIPLPPQHEDTRKVAIELLKKELVGIDDLEALVRFFEVRAMLYLKDLDFKQEADTVVNRAKLLECLQLKDFIEMVIKENNERKKEKETKALPATRRRSIGNANK